MNRYSTALTTIVTTALIFAASQADAGDDYHHYSDRDFSSLFEKRFNTGYVSLNAGVNWLNDTNFTLGTGTGIDTEYDSGYVVRGEVGYNVGRVYFIDNVKLGVELGYSENDVDTHSAIGTNLTGSNGELSAMTYMLNMYHEYQTPSRFVPYYGIGIGWADIEAENYGVAGLPNVLDGDESGFAYQGTLGVNYMVNTNTDIGLRYRYTGTEDLDLRPAGGSGDFAYENHALTANLTYNF